MKNFKNFAYLIAFSTLGFGTAQAHTLAPNVVWSCNANTDPDMFNADIVKVDDKLLAYVSLESGDGDDYAEDFIEVRQVRDGQYQQVDASRPATIPGYKAHASHKSRGTIIQIDLNSLDKGTYSADVSAIKGPLDFEINGRDSNLTMDCEPGPAHKTKK